MAIVYKRIEVWTSEDARWHGRPVHDALVDFIREAGVAARSIVLRGSAGTYENGELATSHIEVLSMNMPVKVEIVLPETEVDSVIEGVQARVTDGVISITDLGVVCHRVSNRLLPRGVKVRDVMTPFPRTVMESTPVSDVIRMLLSSDFNGVPVVDAENRPIGIITQDDLISRAGMPIRLGLLGEIDEAQVSAYLDTIRGMTAQEIMTGPVVTIGADDRLTVAVDKMLARGLKRLPVVDADGKLTGILSRIDVFRAVSSTCPRWGMLRESNVDVAGMRYVRDVIRRDMHTVLPSTPVERIIEIIDCNDIQRVAVVDEDNRLLGMISDGDLFAAFSEHRAGLWEAISRRLGRAEEPGIHGEFAREIRGRRAEEVMKRDLVAVHEDTPISEAIRIMAERGIKRLPVVDEDGVFKGMVSRDSLLRTGV